jgi:hypothetical protein
VQHAWPNAVRTGLVERATDRCFRAARSSGETISREVLAADAFAAMSHCASRRTTQEVTAPRAALAHESIS